MVRLVASMAELNSAPVNGGVEIASSPGRLSLPLAPLMPASS
jgi:hypothetical protein